MMTTQDYLDLPYTMTVRRDDRDATYVARVKEIPSCVAHGETPAAAMEMLRDNFEDWIADCLEHGDVIPVPQEQRSLPSGKWVQRVPRSLHKQLTELAEEEGVSLNQLVVSCLSEALGRHGPSAKQDDLIRGVLHDVKAGLNVWPAPKPYGGSQVVVMFGNHQQMSTLAPWGSSEHMPLPSSHLVLTSSRKGKSMATVKMKSSPVTDPYETFLRTLHLVGLGLDSATATVDRVGLAKAVGEPAMAIHLELTETVLFTEAGQFAVGMDFELSQKPDTNELIVSIKGAYSAVFTCEGSPDKRFVERFSGAEARLVFWPYVRQHISDVSARMSINPILLPLTSEIRSAAAKPSHRENAKSKLEPCL